MFSKIGATVCNKYHVQLQKIICCNEKSEAMVVHLLQNYVEKKKFFLRKYMFFTKYTLFAEKMFLYGKKKFYIEIFLLKKILKYK